MSVVALVGNPREGSRTRTVAVEAAEAVARRLGLPGVHDVIDLSALGPHLLAPGPAPGVEVALELVAEARVLVVASPTYKGTYTGLLKAFLDRLRPEALAGVVALPLLVMGDPKHALAVEVHLRPLLVELGATVPTPGLAVLESQLAVREPPLPGLESRPPALEELLGRWAERVAPQVAAALAVGHPAPA